MFLIGHTAGAHSCALTTLFLTDEREELFTEAGVQRKVVQSVRGVFGKDHYAVHHTASFRYVCILCWFFLDRSEWRLQHSGPLRARTEASSGICLHNAQSHERRGELHIRLTHARAEGAQPGQAEQVRQREQVEWWYISVHQAHLCEPVDVACFFSSRLPQFALLHGSNDGIVPSQSSCKFSALLSCLSIKVSLYLLDIIM